MKSISCGTKAIRRAALLLAVLLASATLFGAARADKAVAFSDWLASFGDGSAPIEPATAPEAPASAPEAEEAVPTPETAAPEAEEAESVAEEAAPEAEAPEPEAEAVAPEAEAPEPEAEAAAPEVVEAAPEEAEVAPEAEEAAPEAAQADDAIAFSDWLSSFGDGSLPMQQTPVPEEAEPAPEATPAPALPMAAKLPEGDAFGALPTLEPAQPLRSARIRAVGDLMTHRKQLDFARKSDGSYDFHSQYALIADSLANADYTIANLETTVGKSRNLDYSGFPMFNTPESLLETLRDAGIDFLTLANNHILDRYFEGMVRTVDLVEQYGFDFGGANRTPEERDAPRVVEVNGIRIGMLCYTQMTNGMEAYCKPDASEYGVNYLRKADFAGDVRRLRDAGADVVIALPHWGEEYRRQPEPNTVALAKLLIASGVDVVLGSHPHMVQPVRFEQAETPDGETRTGLVAYSLGNFICNMTAQHTYYGIILDFTIQERQDGSFGIDNVGCVPVYCWRRQDDVQTLSSLKYLNQKPEGMDSVTWSRMRQTYLNLRELLGGGVAMLEE